MIDIGDHLLREHDNIDNDRIWEVTQNLVPVLRVEVETLLREVDAQLP